MPPKSSGQNPAENCQFYLKMSSSGSLRKAPGQDPAENVQFYFKMSSSGGLRKAPGQDQQKMVNFTLKCPLRDASEKSCWAKKQQQTWNRTFKITFKYTFNEGARRKQEQTL